MVGIEIKKVRHHCSLQPDGTMIEGEIDGVKSSWNAFQFSSVIGGYLRGIQTCPFCSTDLSAEYEQFAKRIAHD